MFNNLTGRSRQSPRQCPVSSNAIASQLVKNGKYTRMKIKRFLNSLCRNCLTFGGRLLQGSKYLRRFSPREFAAFHHLKPGKASGPDSIFPELLIHAGPSLKFWLRGFFSSFLPKIKIPKEWRRALVVAIPKLSKPVVDLQSYRPISLLYDSCKILEPLIYNRVEPIVDPLLLKEQAGFRHEKSTVDQAVLLTLVCFLFYLPYLSSIHEKANCIAILWTGSPHSLGSCLFRGLWTTCLPHKGGGVPLSALPKDTTSELAGLFFTTSSKCRAPSREAADAIF